MKKEEKIKEKLQTENKLNIKDFAYKSLCIGWRKEAKFWNLFNRNK